MTTNADLQAELAGIRAEFAACKHELSRLTNAIEGNGQKGLRVRMEVVEHVQAEYDKRLQQRRNLRGRALDVAQMVFGGVAVSLIVLWLRG